MSETGFQGFPPEALQFYRDVRAHNDEGGKAWFDAHRTDFMEHVVAPAQAFITTLGERLRALRPDVGFDTNHTGRGSFKKIHTDQRFQKGRPPLKTYAQMIFWEGPLKTKKANSTFLVHFDPERVVVGAGMYYFDGRLMADYRAAVADEARGGALRDIVGRLRAAGFTVGGEKYKRVPNGFPSDHPRADLLRHDSLFGYVDVTPAPEALHGPAFVDWCLERHETLAPLHAWCVDFLRSAV